MVTRPQWLPGWRAKDLLKAGIPFLLIMVVVGLPSKCLEHVVLLCLKISILRGTGSCHRRTTTLLDVQNSGLVPQFYCLAYCVN